MGNVCRIGLAGDIGVSGHLGNTLAKVKASASEICRVCQAGPARAELGNNRITGTIERRLEGPGRYRVIRGTRESGHVGGTLAIGGDGKPFILLTATKISGVTQAHAAGLDFGHKGVAKCGTTRARWLDGVTGGEVCRARDSSHVGIGLVVNGNAIGAVVPTSAQVGAIDKGRPRRVNFRYERISIAAVGRLERISGREICGIGQAGDIDIPQGIERYGCALIYTAATQVSGEAQRLSVGGQFCDHSIHRPPKRPLDGP